jgi:hypothetical protein
MMSQETKMALVGVSVRMEPAPAAALHFVSPECMQPGLGVQCRSHLRRAIAPPANLYDFSFLAPCPSSGLIIHGDKDAVVPPRDVNNLVEKLKTQKGIVIEQKVIPGANHFFDGKVEPLMTSIGQYLDKRLGKGGRTTTAA